MFKLFLVFLLIGFFSFSSKGEEEVKILILHQEEDFAKSVFVGSDIDMPLMGEFDIAILPTIIDGKIKPPNSIESALDELVKMLPNWYLSALIKAQKDDECSVTVNQKPVSHYIDSWIWVNWFKSEKSQLKDKFLKKKISEKYLIINALQFAFCDYLQSGKKDKLEDILNIYALKNENKGTPITVVNQITINQ